MRYWSVIFLLVISLGKTNSQSVETFTLDEIIALAQAESPRMKLAEIRKSNAYWSNQLFLSNYKPQIDLNARLPELNRSIQPVIQPDGSTVFRERSQMSNSLQLSLSQPITSTGTTIYASTSVSRLDLFRTNVIDRSVDYQIDPIFVGFVQPLFAYNNLKWDKRIRPMEYEVAKAQFSEEKETIANIAVNHFFQLLNAQTDLISALARKEVADDLYKLGENRFSVGNIAETDLLQLEMDVMRANADIARATLDKQNANEDLRNFLGILEDIEFDLSLDLSIPDIEMDVDFALAHARQHRSQIMDLQAQILTAEANVDRAKAETGINGELSGSFGLTGFGSDLGTAYSSLVDREVVTLRLSVPIADWGRAKSQYEISKSNLELVKMNNELQKVNFENEIKIAIKSFNLVAENVNVAKLSYQASQKRYDLTMKRYKIGKVDITQLNLADREQEAQRQNYVLAVNRFWQAYYDIRALTLYDFINDRSLVTEDEDK